MDRTDLARGFGLPPAQGCDWQNGQRKDGVKLEERQFDRKNGHGYGSEMPTLNAGAMPAKNGK